MGSGRVTKPSPAERWIPERRAPSPHDATSQCVLRCRLHRMHAAALTVTRFSCRRSGQCFPRADTCAWGCPYQPDQRWHHRRSCRGRCLENVDQAIVARVGRNRRTRRLTSIGEGVKVLPVYDIRRYALHLYMNRETLRVFSESHFAVCVRLPCFLVDRVKLRNPVRVRRRRLRRSSTGQCDGSQ